MGSTSSCSFDTSIYAHARLGALDLKKDIAGHSESVKIFLFLPHTSRYCATNYHHSSILSIPVKGVATTNDIVVKLQRLGFSSYEAKAYLALVQKHPAHGYEISKISRVPTAKIYETLVRLKHKGAIIDSNTDPVKYYPVPPETLLCSLKEMF